MSLLQRRLVRLEGIAAAKSPQPPDDVAMADAARVLFDALELAFPDDPWSAGMARQSSMYKIDAAAARFAAGTETDDDRAGFESLPAESVAVFGVDTGAQFAALLAQALAGSLEWEGRTPRFVASAAPDAATPFDAASIADRSPADDQPHAQHSAQP